MSRTVLPIALALAALLSGCDMLGIESAEKVAAARDAEGRAVGGACRHAGRAIEDCYSLNKRADKAAVFAGWRDMNDYMRENKIDSVEPQLAGGKPKPAADEAVADKGTAEKGTAEKAAADKAEKPAKSHAADAHAPAHEPPAHGGA